MNQTTVIAVGTMISAAKIRHLPDGTPVTSFRIACNDRRFDREANAWIDRDTFYVTVTCWRRLAENVCVSLHTGDPLIVRGRIFTRSYDVEGRRNSVTEMEADVVAPDLTRATTVVTRLRRAQEPAAVSVAPPGPGQEADPWTTGGDARSTDVTAQPERELVDAVPASGH
jgi:single-strand DNA-binding protein